MNRIYKCFFFLTHDVDMNGISECFLYRLLI